MTHKDASVWDSSPRRRQSRPSHSTASRRSAIARRLPIATSGTSPTSIRPIDAWRAAKERIQKELPKIGQFKGKLASSPSTLADALDTLYAHRQGAVARVRLRRPARRSGHARIGPAGHAPGDGAAGRGVQRRGVVHRAGDPEDSEGNAREVHRGGTAAEGPSLLPRGHRAARAAHVERLGGADPRRRRSAGRLAVEHLQHPVERRLSLSDRHAQRRQVREARCGGVQRAPRACRTATIARR